MSKIKTYIACVILAISTLWVSGQAVPQQNEISLKGVVLSSETGLPVPGAQVGIAGIASAITDDKGQFSLTQAQEGDILQVRIFGYAYKEVVITSIHITQQEEITILLNDESSYSMYRQVVTPFGNRDLLKTAASLTAIPVSENYKKAAVSIESMIQDGGLGVNTVMRSGMPGAGSNMFLRGFNSMNAGTQPLIVINGVPFENSRMIPSQVSGTFLTPLTGIDVKDIENITVLKDASSIYGSKGANGVILIETAKAVELATIIDFHAYAGLNQNPSSGYYPMMNAAEYRSYLVEMLGTSGMYNSSELQALPYINQEKPVEQKWGYEGNVDYYRYNHDTDWQKEVFRNSMSQNYYLSIKGGDDIALYALSVGYLNHAGSVKNTDFSRYNTQFNSELSVARWLKIVSNTNFSYGIRNLANEGQSPFNPMAVWMKKAPFMTSYLYSVQGVSTPNLESADVFGLSNPSVLTGGEDTEMSLLNKTYRFFGNIGFDASINDYWNLYGTFGVTFDKTREDIFLPSHGLEHGLLPSSIIFNESQDAVSRYLQYYTDAHVGYKREFNRIHSVSGNLGFRYQTNNTEGDWVYAYNSSSDNMRSVQYGILELASISGVLGSWKWLSFYLNGEYGYKNRYFLSYNMAVDGSSRFGKEADGLNVGNNVFGVFPSVTGAWLISSENFMQGINKIDVLKLRLGYSVTGNDEIGNYSARSTYISQSLLGFQGLLIGNISDQLRWETSNKFNVGLDVSAFNERLNFTLDVYHSKTKDMLTWEQSKDYQGVGLYAVNGGNMKNTGFEIGLQGRLVNTAFKWDLGLNIAKYKNKVTALPQDQTITQIAGANILTQVDKPIGLFYGYKTDGVYAASGEAAQAGLNIRMGDGSLVPFKAGDVRFVNQNTDNVIDEADMTVIGDPNPDLFGSIVNRMQWKRFTLDAVFTYSLGNDAYNAVRASAEAMTGYDNQTVNVNNRWSREGHVTTTPRAAWGDPMSNSRFSDRWIEDASYLRLKSISISYDIPMQKVKFFRGLQIYATGLNLFTFTKYMGYDPEFSAMQNPLYYGVDMGIMPQPKTFLVGIKLGL
jgi:TonB-linked SusC/RagA family outer membrane protein